MEKSYKIKITCDQLKGLFDSLDKKANYRSEIINDYHKIIYRLTDLLSFNNLEDYKIPSSAIESGYYSPFGEKYYDGGIVRSKIKQIISVLESEYEIIKNKNKPDTKAITQTNYEISLSQLIKKDLKNVMYKFDAFYSFIENNIIIKLIILIGAIGAGLLLILNLLV